MAKLEKGSISCWAAEVFWHFLIGIAPAVGLLVVTLILHFYYFYMHCTLQEWPFQLSHFGERAYFHGQTHWFGGMQFLFGRWISEPIKDPEGNPTCYPFNHS